ncbi:MAG: DUF177 domain-containing protein [Ruminococcaceae bacterium]|nr:DUF177 domain-containing protein [Oscillospiraceae bacterium]
MRCIMRLDLREIINIPGKSIAFEYAPPIEEIEFVSVARVCPGASVKGSVRNSAGVLLLTAELQADLECICARCLDEFPKHLNQHIESVLAEEVQDEGNTDIYLLEGDYVDLDEVILTAFVLNMEQRFLCHEDCKGLCDKCGKNLNEGPCDCRAEIDPRLAVLGQLLEN